MIYVDTSVVVSALAIEAATAGVQDWLARQPPGALATSDWTITEFSSAMAMKHRLGEFSLSEQAEALAAFRRLTQQNIAVLSVSREDFHMAAEFCNRADLKLRSPDALHLAVASRTATRLATLDKQFARAARAIGIDVEEMGAIPQA